MPTKVLSVSVVAYGGQGFKLFDYLPQQDHSVSLGSIVRVPFGRQESLGVIMKISKPTSEINTLNKNNPRELMPILGTIVDGVLPAYIRELAEWMCDFYCASPRAVWRTILPSGLAQSPRLKARELKSLRDAVGHKLTSAQKAAITTIEAQEHRGFLLHGITGSGKTEVYIRLIKRQLEQGKSCIVLVPEIALAPQMTERLSQHFHKQLIVNHSKLTPARRKKIWFDCLNSDEPNVIVGPRSSLFLPLKKLGLVVVDEEHEGSYKQENAPSYQATAITAKLCQLTGATYVLGSATPSIHAYTLAQAGKIGYVRLQERAMGTQLPQVDIIELKGSGPLLSPQLVKEMRAVLKKGKQVLLFLNRRGSASALVCHDCGYIVICPNCDTSLTFHGDIARLVCHYCNFRILPPTTCPKCESLDLGFVGSGTKKVEENLQALFGNYKIGRLDSDNADLAHLEEIYNQLKSGELDIVIGTQMIARGLDIAGIELVGVISTESMLAVADFTSNERTFQLLTQVAGRAGRSETRGKAIIQTYSPRHPSIIAASHHDYGMFYESELASRRAHSYPPFTYLVKLVYGHKIQAKAIAEASNAADKIQAEWPTVRVLGPAERSIKRVAGRYQQRIIIKSRRRDDLVKIVAGLSAGWKHDLDPISLM